MAYTKELNIYERMSFVENELPQIAKGMEIGKGKNSYKAVGEATVLNAVKPLEFEYRIKSLPIKREVIKQECYETELEGYTKRLFFISIKTTFRFINLDNTADYVDIESLGDGTDPLDKASGKAQTYADKFALLKAYKAITGEDTDNSHSDVDEEREKKAYKKYQPKPESTPRNNDEMVAEGVKRGIAVLEHKCDKAGNDSGVIKSQFLKKHNWNSMKDITFKDNLEFKILMAEIKELVDSNEEMKEVGI